MRCALCGADVYNLALRRAIVWPHRWRCLDVQTCAAWQVRREQEGEGDVMLNDDERRLILTDPAFSAGYKMGVAVIRAHLKRARAEWQTVAAAGGDTAHLVGRIEALCDVLREMGIDPVDTDDAV